MSAINTHDSITKLSMAVHEAADAIIRAELVPEQSTPQALQRCWQPTPTT